VATQINRRDLPWVILIAVSFLFALIVSWERWGNPLVDCGREMNQPLRLAEGQTLYSDVRHIYGPLSPYANAALFKLLGAHLWVLYAIGIFTALLILSLTYWLSRQLMGRAAAAAATLSVLWLCAMKPAGNYILPYSYSALHGCALGLVTLALLVKAASIATARKAANGPHPGAAHGKRLLLFFVAAGIFAGLAALAKTEMGLAAFVTGVVAAAVINYPNYRRVLLFALAFMTPAVALVSTVYTAIAGRVGWDTLAVDSFLFLGNVAPELIYFNERVSGLDQPLASLAQMVGACIRIATLALIIASVSMLLTRKARSEVATNRTISDLTMSDAGRASVLQLWLVLGASVIAFFIVPLTGSLTWDKGPYLAMPVLLIGTLIHYLIRLQQQTAQSTPARASLTLNRQTVIIIIVAAYALASLARVVLRVRSGGAYSSYLLPSSIIIFTFLWASLFPGLFGNGSTRRMARTIVLIIIIGDAMLTGGVLAYRYQVRNTYALSSERGTIITLPDIGKAFDEAIELINQETRPNEPIAVFPEGTSLGFFTGRRNPLREEITTPGFLDSAGEQRAINQLAESGTRFIFISNRATPEFGPVTFGGDYCRTLMRWIEGRYELYRVLGPNPDPNLQIGEKPFFIRVYKLKSTPDALAGPQ
jgi:4-amino-4-deoxy-L-arabinose transferase-like glycosyltransferase